MNDEQEKQFHEMLARWDPLIPVQNWDSERRRLEYLERYFYEKLYGWEPSENPAALVASLQAVIVQLENHLLKRPIKP